MISTPCAINGKSRSPAMFKPITAPLATLALLIAALNLPAQTAPVAAPAATQPLSDLKISLMDGSLLTGKLSVSELAIDTKFGPLKVPVDQITGFMPGLHSHPKFQQQLDANVAA